MQDDLLDLLRNADVRFVRVVWCDNANVIRGKAIHVRSLQDYLTHGVGMSTAQQAVPAMYDAIVEASGLSPVGEVRLMPDWTTLNALPYANGHARVLADMMAESRPWPLCPRDFLRRMAADAASEELEIRAAFENEFYLLRTHGEQVLPADDTVFAASISMDVNTQIINEIADALLNQDIVVELYHPESGPGQQELSVQHAPALNAADRQIVLRETVHAIALRNGLHASFLPKIFPNQAGSGCHLHLSLWRGDENIFSGKPAKGSRSHVGISRVGEAFAAGVLAHLPALMGITTPTCNSYRRLQPQTLSGAFRCWGVDNREAAIRVPSVPSGPPTNFELKTVDASSNPYLALGAVIACGLDGVRHDMKLPTQIDVDPGALAEKERNKRGIERLPRSLDESLQALRKDKVLLNALGAPLAKAYLAVHKAEWEALHGISLEDEVSLLLERY